MARIRLDCARSRFHATLPIAALAALILSGCASLDKATVETGPRFDEDGKFTDTSKATFPIFKSSTD